MTETTSYAYLDEAGDLNFKGNGSKYFIMTCVHCERPFKACHELLDLRYDMLESGDLAGYFHASEDRIVVREKVFGVILDHLSEFRVWSAIIDKATLDPDVTPREVYQLAFETLFSLPAEEDGRNYRLILTDDLPKATRKGDIKGALKGIVKKWSGENSRYRLIHQRSEGDFNLQIADYFCWALYRKEERGDELWFSRLSEAWERRIVVAADKNDPPTYPSPEEPTCGSCQKGGTFDKSIPQIVGFG